MTAQLTPTTVIGDGFLAAHLAARLRDVPALVLVAELDRLAEHNDTIVECLGTGRPLLFVGTWRSFVYIGPYWRPGTAGCPHCLVTRTANSPFGPDFAGDALAEAVPRDIDVCVLGPAVLGMVEAYVRAATDDGSVIVVDGQNGTAERRTLLADSTCPSCGVTTSDTVPVFTDAPLTKLAPTTLRTAELDAETVEREYLFSGLGLFTEVRQDLQSPIGACSVELSTRWGRREPAIGRGRTYRGSRTIAVLEGLERYAGLHRGGRRAPVRAAYREVADTAVHPLDLGTHPRESYRLPGFRYREFHPDTVVDWVWAYSFRRRDRVLVPERAAFWGPRHDGETAFVYDTSNGCALGNSAEEAVLHGLREVAERDSFLLTWYRRLTLPEVDLATAPESVRALVRKARLFTGFGFRAFQSTMEYGMPTFWLVAENTADDGPRVLAGAGAHPDPAQAIAGGLHELIGSVMATQHSYPRRRPDGLAMLADPGLITRMEDHSLVGALPEARERYAFLLDGDHDRVALADVPALVTTGDDLRADLDLAVSGVLAAGLDVLVVDQTMPELRRTGLACVRVLVPGAVPMTFGHRNRRTVGLPRLTEGAGVPYRSGLADGEEVGCVPHPFP
ncbi:TOMM precursor leader peptide-binding protein [Actinokineospora sp. UTMC 2448]|uniref:TOMM precursor leader peptide-binding protein n=1 Tax=Actinokineospora sp. UTMC 2448 TaxID=2268449 RepID=UPI00216435AF|nr:TOMM precursor leader peptide-binding protein [Actinokineospora sp. UTMC 2448]UVS78670.1 Cyclodehydrogenase-YcaO superfammily PerG [Actinokineospora sp. UTMC 2448]